MQFPSAMIHECMNYSSIALLINLVFINFVTATAIPCGFPGRPAFGRILVPDLAKRFYAEGETVGFACNSGYYMKGKATRKCLENGVWSNNICVCDSPLLEFGNASSREFLSLYPPEAAIDGDIRTCFYSNRYKPRFWRLQLLSTHRVVAVSVTVPFASSQHSFTISVIDFKNTSMHFNRCVSFKGTFVTQSKILVCEYDGVIGSVLHVEDNSKQYEYLALCEVRVFVEKDMYECGEPELPANSLPTESHKGNQVEYGCVNGYRLAGPSTRICQNSGHWSETQPICIEVTCREPDSIINGYWRINGPSEARPVLSSETTYTCDPGYYLLGNSTLICLSDGLWSSATPICQPIDCGPPNDSNAIGGRFLLINGTTTFKSSARLECLYGNRPIGTNYVIYCDEYGSWSKLHATCLQRMTAAFESELNSINNRVDNKLATVLLCTVFSLLLCVLSFVAFLFKKNIISLKVNTNWKRKSQCIRREIHNEVKLCESNDRTTNCNKSNLEINEFRCSAAARRSQMNNITSDNEYEEISIDNAIAERTGRIDAVSPRASTSANLQVSDSADIENRTESSAVLALYAKVDFVQKRKDRCESNGGTKVVEDQKQREVVKADVELLPANFHQQLFAMNFDKNGEFCESSSNEQISRKSKHYFVIDNVAYAGHPSVAVECHDDSL